jgi:hypothetical protein
MHEGSSGYGVGVGRTREPDGESDVSKGNDKATAEHMSGKYLSCKKICHTTLRLSIKRKLYHVNTCNNF